MSDHPLVTVSCLRREDFPHMARAGVEGADFGFYAPDLAKGWLLRDDYREQAAAIAQAARDVHLPITQTHAHILGYWDYTMQNQPALTTFRRSIEASALVGSPLTVVHLLFAPDCLYGENMAACEEINLRFLSEAFELGSRFGVEICLENLFNWFPGSQMPVRTISSTAESLLEVTHHLGMDHARFCVDVGHAILVQQSPQGLLRDLKGRVAVLHLHDNNLIRDDHLPPYLGRLNWHEILRALRETDYAGNLNFETLSFESRYPEPLLENAYRFLYGIGCYLRDELEKM